MLGILFFSRPWKCNILIHGERVHGAKRFWITVINYFIQQAHYKYFEKMNKSTNVKSKQKQMWLAKVSQSHWIILIHLSVIRCRQCEILSFLKSIHCPLHFINLPRVINNITVWVSSYSILKIIHVIITTVIVFNITFNISHSM